MSGQPKKPHASEEISTPAPQVDFTHVSGISWPRSGHHLLVRLLTGYFGPAFVYCEFHQGHPTNPELGDCCRNAPCKKAQSVVFTKNHDFHLETPLIEGQKYLVQSREYAPSVVSNFELAVRSGLPDNPKSFRIFVSKQFGNYLAFRAKWISSKFAESQNVLQMPYEDLVAAPEIVLALAIRHITNGHVPDEDRIKEVVARVDGQKVAKKQIHILENSGVHNDRNLENFRFYNPNLFEAISAMRLNRETVLECFEKILNRLPAEGNMIHWQGFETIDALTAQLKKTSEYRNRMADHTTPKADG